MFELTLINSYQRGIKMCNEEIHILRQRIIKIENDIKHYEARIAKLSK